MSGDMFIPAIVINDDYLRETLEAALLREHSRLTATLTGYREGDVETLTDPKVVNLINNTMTAMSQNLAALTTVRKAERVPRERSDIHAETGTVPPESFSNVLPWPEDQGF